MNGGHGTVEFCACALMDEAAFKLDRARTALQMLVNLIDENADHLRLTYSVAVAEQTLAEINADPPANDREHNGKV